MKTRYVIIIASLLICSAFTITGSHPSDESGMTEQRLYTELYIWGGEDQDVYLGKLNGSKYDSESIWNKYGKYGNKYNSNS